METTDVENYPGFPEGILGPELIEVMKKQALRFGLNYVEGQVAEADLSRRPFKLVTDDGRAFQCRTLIISTGASARWLGLEKEQKLKMGGGVSACATCDGALPMYRGQELAVVGGGDSAMEEALFLTRFASKVTIIHRRDAFRASKIMQQRALSNPKIAVKWNRVVEDLIETNERLAGLVLRDTVNRATEHFPVGGLFVAIGHTPNTAFLKGQVETDAQGFIKVREPTTRTSVEGVFACGDVMDPVYKQAVTAAGTGCRAAIDAERFLEAEGD